METLKPFYNLANNYYKEKYDHLNLAIKTADESNYFCNKQLTYWGIRALVLFFIITIVWLIYDIFYNVSLYFKMNTFFYFKKDKRLYDSPLFKQITHLYYINDFLTVDFIFILMVITPIFVIWKIGLFETLTGEKGKFSSTLILNYAILIIGVIYFFFVYNNLANLGARINVVNNLIYDNISAEFINSQGFCNYLNKKSNFDYDFAYGKCNHLRNNISIAKLYDYIRKIMLEIGQNVAPINNISADKFKKLKDKNGILYKDRIISAFFTYQLIKYYIDNDLEDEAKEFFSAFNLIYLKKSPNIIKTRINPILYLRYDDIMLFNKILEYNNEMENSFSGNKEIYNLIYKEYNSIQTNVQNIVVDIYNICSYKLISVYVYYFIIFIILMVLIVIYVYNNLYK
jgi:hypothetical protein